MSSSRRSVANVVAGPSGAFKLRPLHQSSPATTARDSIRVGRTDRVTSHDATGAKHGVICGSEATIETFQKRKAVASKHLAGFGAIQVLIRSSTIACDSFSKAPDPGETDRHLH